MYESTVVLENPGYKNEQVAPNGKKKVIFSNSSEMHVTITAIDPATSSCVELIVRKDSLPNFITNNP